MTTASAIELGAMQVDEWPSVERIYAQGIATGKATFETSPPSWEEWDARHLPAPRLVARSATGAVGWAALSSVSDRCFYAGVAEHSIYVDERARGCGIGRRLLDALCRESEDAGIWTIQTRIFPENAASLALHTRCGFRVVGVRERIGQLHGVWRDVLFLERRSQRI